jgi:sporulation protein YlmC with PRC-barrel domain
MATRLDRSATALAAAILLAYGTAADAQESTRNGPAQRADRAATAQAPAGAQAVRDMRMSELIGMDVRNARGENLGDVQDVVVDTENGRVSYVVVGIGGFLGIGEKLSAFPMGAFKVAQAGTRGDPVSAGRAGTTDRSPGNPLDNDGVRGDKGPIGSDRAGAGSGTSASRMLPGRGTGGMHLVLDADPERLKRAPNFDRDQWPDWNDAKYRGEVDRAAGATGAAKVGRLLRGSQLADADIRDGRNANVGEVEDLVVDVRTGMVRYAVVDFDQAWTPDDKLVAVPIKALRPAGDKGELVFSGERSQLQRAPSFDKGKWPDLNAGTYRSDVDRYVSGWSANRGAATPGSGTAATADGDGTRGATAARSGAAGGGTTDRPRTPATGGTTDRSTPPPTGGTSR